MLVVDEEVDAGDEDDDADDDRDDHESEVEIAHPIREVPIPIGRCRDPIAKKIKLGFENFEIQFGDFSRSDFVSLWRNQTGEGGDEHS